MSDPYKEASKYTTAARRLNKWRDEYVEKIERQYQEKMTALNNALSPAATRVVMAAENDCESPAMVAGDPEVPPLPEWTREVPPLVPPGGIVEVEEKPRKRA